MKLFPWQKDPEFYSEKEKQQLVDAIQKAEQRTSGEVRVFVESRCRFINAADRAKEIFYKLEMFKTEQRNATLIYLAVKDRQAAVYGDEGIHQKVGTDYWKELVTRMLNYFREEKLADGVCHGISALGESLHNYFPYNNDSDKNELPDEIVFGR